MRIAWIANVTEAEHDVVQSAKQHPDVQLDVWSTTGPVPEHGWFGAFTNDTIGRIEMLRQIETRKYDLLVFRYPTWVDGEVDSYFKHLFSSDKCVAWQSEQGPTLSWALGASKHFKHVAVNNRLEMDAYRKSLPNAHIHYLPVGSAPPDLGPSILDRRDLLADGGCHYRCGEYGGIKAVSVDTLVIPGLEHPSMSLYGPSNHEHGWSGVPGFEKAYCGAFPPKDYATYYRAHKVYIGISWNWKHGGYGIKLARALSAGICVLWHRTVGMDLDGLIEGTHLFCSGSAEETRDKIRFLLAHDDERLRVANAGQAFAFEQWDWCANLKKVAQEMLK